MVTQRDLFGVVVRFSLPPACSRGGRFSVTAFAPSFAAFFRYVPLTQTQRDGFGELIALSS